VYVNDIILIGVCLSEIERFKDLLNNSFMIRYVEDLKYFLDWKLSDPRKEFTYTKENMLLTY